MRTLLYSLGLTFAVTTIVVAQQKDIAGNASRESVRGLSVAEKSSTRYTGTTTGTSKDAKFASMPIVRYYSIAEGEDEDFPPGLYATFLPTAPDTVTVLDEGSTSHRSYNVEPGREMIHGDSASVFSEVGFRQDSYAGMGTLPAKTKSFVTRSGFIPIERLGKDRFTFAVKPSHFRIAPGAMISASVHVEEDEHIASVLCAVSAIDYEQNTFTIETSRTVPVGETINWVIINYPE
jgi:hypothetical protein